MSRLTARSSYRNWALAVAVHVFVFVFAGSCQANEASSYESYFEDEVTSATCDRTCLEEWGLKRTYICQLAMNDMKYRQVPEYCEI